MCSEVRTGWGKAKGRVMMVVSFLPGVIEEAGFENLIFVHWGTPDRALNSAWLILAAQVLGKIAKDQYSSQKRRTSRGRWKGGGRMREANGKEWVYGIVEKNWAMGDSGVNRWVLEMA